MVRRMDYIVAAIPWDENRDVMFASGPENDFTWHHRVEQATVHQEKPYAQALKRRAEEYGTLGRANVIIANKHIVRALLKHGAREASADGAILAEA